ncbi:MAG: porin [Roseibium sp.]|nr:porin [Roseibium sp.]
MNFKSLMLGAAAATAVTGAHAADLPVAPEPVDYVRICDAYGSGFFYIPGTETCLRVGGRVRTEFRFNDFGDEGGNSWDADTDTSTAFRARGYVRLDARTNTEFGLLRTYTELFFTNTTGAGNPVGSDARVNLDKAFVQFGGLTAGRAGSFYDFYTGANWGAVLNMGFADNGAVNLFAYTAAFGNGFSASVSVEDGTDRRAALRTVGAGAPTTLGGVTLTGGHKYPDLVANLRVDQGWGSAQIMGALHQVYFNRSGAGSRTAGNELGWAIGAGVKFNLPMISNSTELGFQAAYSDGAPNFAASSNSATADAIVNAAGTAISTTTRFAIGGGISHSWTPTLSSGLTASYIDTDHGFTVQDSTEWNVQGNLVWSPVSGLAIGAELEYTNQDWSTGGTSGFVDNDAIVGVLRVQRTF